VQSRGPRWQPGDSVAVRYITRDGKPGMSWPFVVVQDTADLVALFIPQGALHKRWTGTGPNRHLEDQRWRNDTVRLMYPGAHHSIWPTWNTEAGQRRFTGYYVNMEEPFRRTPIGFDTNDHMLDIVVAPDLSWQWKDEAIMADRVTQGVYSAEFAAAARAEGERVIEAIEHRKAPFSSGWDRWAPDPTWSIPTLLETWDQEPPRLWDRRLWAYGDIAR
jgi:hypothetical protein